MRVRLEAARALALIENSIIGWAREVNLATPTPIGRMTVDVLSVNLSHRIQLRKALRDEGVFPPAPS